jgi:hypothetical protein
LNGTGLHTARRLERQAQAIKAVKREAEEVEAKCREEEAARLRRRERRLEQEDRELRRKARLRVVLIACAIVTLVGGATYGLIFRHNQINHGTGEEDILAYVPADSALILGANYSNVAMGEGFPPLLNQSVEKGLGVGTFLAECANNTYLGPGDLFNTIIVAVGPERVPSLTLIGKSKSAFDQRRIMRSAGSVRHHKYAGMNYFDIDAPPFTTLIMPSDHILILTSASPSEATRMIGSKGQETALPEGMLLSARPLKENTLWGVWSTSGVPADALRQRLSTFEAKPRRTYHRLDESFQKTRR